MALSRKAALLYANLVDAATITASSQTSAGPVLNLKTEHLVTKWRSTATPAWLLIDLGASVPLDTFGIFGLTATSVRFRASNNGLDASEGEVFDSGVITVDQTYKQAVALMETQASARYVLIDLVNAGGSYVEAGIPAIGKRVSWTYNMAFGFDVTYVDPSGETVTAGQQDILDALPSYRVMSPTFAFVKEEDRAAFVDLVAMKIGKKKSVLFIKDQGGNLQRDAIWGRNTIDTQVVHDNYDTHNVKYRFKERQ